MLAFVYEVRVCIMKLELFCVFSPTIEMVDRSVNNNNNNNNKNSFRVVVV